MDLIVNDVHYSYGQKEAVKGVSFEASRGEVVGILGQNGCGKTTLLKCINGSNNPTSGNVVLDGEDTSSMSKKAIARKMAFVTQTNNITFPFTVFETVMMGRYAHQSFISEESDHDVDVVTQSMIDAGILDFKDRRINELSGGERRRVFIAQALAQEPEILLLDEPTLHLDINHQFGLLVLVRRLSREKNILILIVTHDIILASRYCDKIIFMENGVMKDIGPTDVVATVENYRRIFKIVTEISQDPRFGLDVTLVERDHDQ